MDTKRLIYSMMLAMVLIFAWQIGFDVLFKKMGWQTAPQPQRTAPTTGPSLSAQHPSPTTAPVAGATIAAGTSIVAVPTTGPSSIVIGSVQHDDPSWPLALSISSRGAGVESVTLNQFRAKENGPELYTFQKPYEGYPDQSRVLATRSITINGSPIDLSAAAWRVAERSDHSAAFDIDLSDTAGAPLARVTKVFRLSPRNDVPNGSGYDVSVEQTVLNLSNKPLEVAALVNGPTTPPRELDRGSDRSIVGGYLDGPNVLVGHYYVEQFSAETPTRDYTRSEKGDLPLLWTGTTSVYFDALLRPRAKSDTEMAAYIESVKAQSLNPDAPSDQQSVALTIQTKSQSVEPGKSASFHIRAFFGPKQRSLLNDAYYGVLPRMYNATLVLTSGLCAFCTFQWLINLLVGMLNVFHWMLLKDWGLAIIALVFVVRALLHPITKRSQVSMMKMGKMGPEMERLKKKYGDNKDELNKAMMQLYKEQGFTPILGCLPMFLQMPIWIALWSALQSTFELRHAGFLRFGSVHLTWISDLSQPDHLIEFAKPFSLFGLITVSGFNVLPLLLGVVFYLQQKFTPKPPATTPEQEQQQKIMQWMTLLFPVMLYGGPSGLNLYILASTSFGIIESIVIRKHIRQRDEAEKAGRIIVDPGKKKGGPESKRSAAEPTKPRGGLSGWISGLQERADQLRREADRRGRDKA
ncbi:MAG: YidC/Oxa1 family insertase periplasmic-domain containing protein [Tepidisphaeraceae bacterium]